MIGEPTMTIHSAEDAGKNINHLLETASTAHSPILIRGDHATGVLVSEDDWRAIQETLYLLSIPGMRESILQGMAIPISECSDRVEW